MSVKDAVEIEIEIEIEGERKADLVRALYCPSN